MKETTTVTGNTSKEHSNFISESLPNVNEIYASLPYVKFLPEVSPEIHQRFLQASGDVDYQPTLNYMFQALFQENKEALTNLVCSVLHWPHEKVKSIEITNPITLGKYVENKTFILDIKILMNDDTIINLEMQLNNFNNWPERSLGYLCRSFDNLNKGEDYINTKSAIHIGFLDFTLFPNLPEFHATYKMQNMKNHNVYTDKFILHVIELNSIHLATMEDHDYEIDKWASFFKAKKWEDIRMLVNENPSLQSAAETLYQLNMNEQLRETCDRFIRAEARENATKRQIAKLTQELADKEIELANKEAEIADKKAEIADKEAEIADKEAEIADKEAEIADKEAEIADKEAEIARLNALLTKQDHVKK